MPRLFISQIDSVTRHNFKWDFVSALLYGLYAGLFMPFVAATGIRLGATNLAVGLLTAAPCAALLASFYWGSLVQHKPKLPFVVLPNVVGRGMLLLMMFVVSPWPYVGIIFLFWIVTSIPSSPYAGLMELIYPREYRGRLLAYVRVAVGICQLATVAIAGKLLDSLGYRVMFPAAAVIGVLSSLAFWRIKEPRIDSMPHSAATRPAGLREQLGVLIRDRVFLMWEIGFTVFGFGNLFLAPVLPVFQVRHLGLSNTQISMIAMCWTLSWLVAYPFWGTFIDRRGPGRAIIMTIVLFGLCPMAYYAGGTFRAALLGAVFNGVAEAGIDIGWMNQCIKLAPGRASLYSGLHLTILGIRGTIGPLLGAALLPYLGLGNSLLFGAIVIFAGVLPMVVAHTWERREGARDVLSG